TLGGDIMTSLQSRFGLSVLCALAALLVMSALARAQDYRGKAQGQVTDANNAALAGANVTLRNVGTGVEVTRQTNSEGRYIFHFVESGAYSIIVEATGFKKYEQRNITVHIRGDVTVFNNLNWDNPVLDFTNAKFGQVISKRPGYIGREIQYGFKFSF